MPWVTASCCCRCWGRSRCWPCPRPRRLRQARIHALAAGGGTLVFTAILVGLFDQSVPGLQYIDHVGWAEGVGLSWDVGVDGISLWLLLLTAVIFLLAVLAACWRPPERPRAFLALLLLAETGLLGLFAAGDLVLFYVFWEAMLIPFYFLIGMWGGAGRGRANITLRHLHDGRRLLMLVAILATAFIGAATSPASSPSRSATWPASHFTDTQSTWLFLGFALAFVIKLPLWPFHGWLPGAYRAAPILVTGLLAAVMSKAGRLRPAAHRPARVPGGRRPLRDPDRGARASSASSTGRWWRGASRRCGGWWPTRAWPTWGSSPWGSWRSTSRRRRAPCSRWSTTASWSRGVRDRGGAEPRRAGRPHRRIGGLADGAPRMAGMFLIVAMAALAIPGSNTFVGEFFILTGVFRQHLWLAVLACIGIAYAAVYMLRHLPGHDERPAPWRRPRASSCAPAT